MRKAFSVCLFIALPALLQAVPPRPESARPYGMGDAFTGLSNDFNAVFFNPAGLASVKMAELSAMAGRSYSEFPFPQSEMHFSGTFPLAIYRDNFDRGTLGYFVHRSGREGDNVVTNYGAGFGCRVSQLLSSRIALLPELQKLEVGLNIRARDIYAGGSNRFGLGVDLGFLYRFEEGQTALGSGWSVGAAIQEMNQSNISAPVLYRLGAAWKADQLTVVLDYLTQGGVGRFQPGIEYALFRRLLLLRAGSPQPSDEARQITLGMGTVLPPIQLDLAFGFQPDGISRAHDRVLLAFTYRFGLPLLSQYFYQERVDKVDAIENKVANLEAQKSTLKASIAESRDLYEAMRVDFDKARAKTEEAKKELRAWEDQIDERRKELQKTERELQSLEQKKKRLEDRLSGKRSAEGTEIRPPHSGPARRHRVESGDTLRGLAQRYYGDPNQWQVIYDENENKIIRGVPREGEELIIP